MGAPAGVPAPFERLPGSPFHEHLGPLYVDRTGPLPVVGVRVGPHHTNSLGVAHGGVLASLADIALGQALRLHIPDGARPATADLHIVFLESASEGDWLEARPHADRVGRSAVQLSCVVSRAGHHIAKASGTFVVRPPA